MKAYKMKVSVYAGFEDTARIEIGQCLDNQKFIYTRAVYQGTHNTHVYTLQIPFDKSLGPLTEDLLGIDGVTEIAYSKLEQQQTKREPPPRKAKKQPQRAVYA